MRVPKGYKILIIAPSGEVVQTLNPEGYNLDKVYARADIISEIQIAIERDSKDSEVPQNPHRS